MFVENINKMELSDSLLNDFFKKMTPGTFAYLCCTENDNKLIKTSEDRRSVYNKLSKKDIVEISLVK